MTLLPPLPDHRPLRPLDDLAAAMERKWGVDRLPRLVPAELRARWDAATAMHANEWPDALPARREALDAMLMRAWQALDAAATAAGAEPCPAACWEVALPEVPGAVYAVAQDDAHASALLLRAQAEGRQGYAVWTLEEVARVMRAASPVAAVKAQWPAAKVVPLRPRQPLPPGGDDISDILPLDGEAGL